jgi:hypothetical protein
VLLRSSWLTTIGRLRWRVGALLGWRHNLQKRNQSLQIDPNSSTLTKTFRINQEVSSRVLFRRAIQLKITITRAFRVSCNRTYCWSVGSTNLSVFDLLNISKYKLNCSIHFKRKGKPTFNVKNSEYVARIFSF